MSASRDPSRRYILAEDAPYVANLAALWGSDPELARQIEELEGQELQGGYAVEPSKAGPPTVAVSNDDGKAVYLHSRYQPLDEARRLVENLATDEQVAFFIHGFGLGYHVEMLFERVSEEALLCVIEPDLKLLRTALWQRDFSKLLASGRVVFLTQANKAELFLRLQAHQAILSLGAAVVVHPPSMQCHPAFHQQMREWVQEFSSYCRTSINTLVLNGKRTAENIARNLAWYVATADLQRLKNCYHNKPAVIVSAGPSLRKNKHLLKDLQGKAVLISVQTMLQPLLEMGIEPHFVTSLDYHDICTRFFEKLPKNLKTELVAEPKATSKIFSLHPGPLSLLGNDFAESLLREMKLNKEKLPAGATVAHLAYCLAEYLGCNPIVFVGQDLGFSDGLCYAAGTSYEDVWRPEMSRFCTIEMKQWEQIVRDRKILRRIPDIHGNPMYTEERLFTYLQHFERDFATSDRTIIDATEGGAMKRGTRVMKLAEVIAQYCTEGTKAQRHEGTKEETTSPFVPSCLLPPCLLAPPYPQPRWDRLEECVASLQFRKSEAGQIEQISRDTLPLLREIREHIVDQPRVNRAIARIDTLRARMNDLGPCYDLITQLTQLSELNRFRSDRRILAAKVSGIELQRRQVDRDIENVRALADAAGEFQKLMGEVIQQVGTWQQRQREAA
ncbi:MAG TPA: 6-hydroxymethylpterin diphosphokinase MptE-like protein [Tepidisphaeraceae bacterium]